MNEQQRPCGHLSRAKKWVSSGGYASIIHQPFMLTNQVARKTNCFSLSTVGQVLSKDSQNIFTRDFHKRFDIGRNSATHPLPDWREQRLETLLTDKDSNRNPLLLTQRQLEGARQWIPSLSKTGWVHISRPGPHSESLKEKTATAQP